MFIRLSVRPFLLLLVVLTGCGVPAAPQGGVGATATVGTPLASSALPTATVSNQPATATVTVAAVVTQPSSPTVPATATWQMVEWVGLRIPLPPEAQWQPQLQTMPPTPMLIPYAHAAITYPTGGDKQHNGGDPIFVVSPWGGSIEDWIDAERGMGAQAVDGASVRDTTVAGLPAKVYQPVATGACTAGVYVALLPQDKLLYIRTNCLGRDLSEQVIHGITLSPATPSPVGEQPCPPPLTGPSIADYAPIMKFDGIVYMDSGGTISEAELGPEYARVRCKMQGHAYDPLGGLQDGYAAFFDPGTPVYAVRGYRPSFRLAAYQHDRWVIFEANDNPQAQRGADFLDLKDKVERIVIHRAHPGDSPAAASIAEPQEIAALVEMIESAPVDHTRRTPGQDVYWLLFTFLDGTQTIQLYELGERRIGRGIVLPPAFQTALDRALGTTANTSCTLPAPTPTVNGITLPIYFGCAHGRHPVYRELPGMAEPQARLTAVLQAVVAGPTAAEQAVGFESLFTEATAKIVKQVTLTDSHAVINLAGSVRGMHNASASAAAHSLLHDLNDNVFQLFEVDQVTYQIDGSSEAFAAWLQLAQSSTTRAEWLAHRATD